MPIDYESARELLAASFARAESCLLDGVAPAAPAALAAPCEQIFQSNTQAYREALLGCVVARIQDRSIDLRLPYVNQGDNAFNGRTLDTAVINPFLQDKRVPGTKGAYLSVFRRSVRFEPATRDGLRDKAGFDAFLAALDYIRETSEAAALHGILDYLLYRFARLRDAANVPVTRLQRISLEQYDQLLSGLLATPSGGRFPMLLAVAAFQAIKEFFGLDWDIAWQGINVADTASGAGGDITIAHAGQIVMAVEITERAVERSRVVATFNTKIAPAGIGDYLFFVRSPDIDPAARQQARQYFAQGHEVNFVEIKAWILTILATIGSPGRGGFNRALVELLESPDIPSAMKVAWNDQITQAIAM